MPNEERIGFHKGCLDTLMKEREELLKIISVTEQLMAVHIKSLKELGVDLQKQMEDAKKQTEANKGLEKQVKK